MKRSSIGLTIVLFLFVSLSVSAQTAQVGVLTGTVRDQTGAVLPGVTVEARHSEKGIVRAATTDTSGKFRMPGMAIGMYTISASLTGFETESLRDNRLEQDKTTDVNIKMRLGATAAAITVTGEIPMVDKTNVAVQTRVRCDDFQKLPVGRSYQALIGFAPGIPTTAGGNVNAHGALTSNNQFLFDGVDITDPTTGTFASNLNFEAIQEMTIYTAGVSAEYGRAVGAVVNVITKSGGNNLSGSAKWIGSNDNWNDQNRTHNEVTGASLARTKFDHVNPVQSYTLGGPVWRDHAWFFGAYEKAKNSTAQRQTLVSNENYQQTTVSPFWDGRVTFQINPSNNVWIKKHASPTGGFIIDYWGGAADLGSLTGQDQTGNSLAGQWTGVFGSNMTVEAIGGKTGETITVGTYSPTSLNNGAPHYNLTDRLYYNGATFVGAVDRPRRQFNVAATYFAQMGQSSHNLKVGYDWQSMRSTNVFGYPNNQFFIDESFDWKTRTFVPSSRQDYDVPIPSTSRGKIQSLYARDKFNITNRWFIEGGLRYEKQNGSSDIGQLTVNAHDLSPRLSASYDLAGNGKSIILATAGRFYQFIIQDLSDRFNQFAPQSNYNNFNWDPATKQYVAAGRITASGNSFTPNTSLKATYTTEVTLGFQQQIGNTMAFGIRGVARKWGDLIDDIRGFNPDLTTYRQVVNYGPAKRSYRSAEFTFEKRFSQHWYANANYTYSRLTGNHFFDTFSSLGDYVDAQCRTTADPTIGNGGVIPCLEVQNGRNKTGRGDTTSDFDGRTT